MKYTTCPLCGSNLDHGEICDCGKDDTAREAAKTETRNIETRRRGYGLSQGISGGASVLHNKV